MKKQLLVLSGCLLAVFCLSAIDRAQNAQEHEKPKNLKVLPKTISHEELEGTMKAFNKALGVKCNHCHAPKANGERGLDFASDANPKKDIARSMIKMTQKINSKYFKDHVKDGALMQIGCSTCHNGQVEPQMRKM